MIWFYYLLRRFTKAAYPIRGIGLGRVCEFVRRRVAKTAPPKAMLIEDFQKSGKFWCYLQEHMGSQIFFRGAYSADSLAVLGQYVRPDTVFLDIGANHGEFTIAVALLAPKGATVAFEPVPRNLDRLRLNVETNNLTNVKIIPIGLSDKDGEFPIFDQETTYADGTRNEGLASLFASGNRSQSATSVPVKRLDDVWPTLGLPRVDIIKLDIEGAEWHALRGGFKLVTEYKPLLLVEIGQVTCNAAGYRADEFAQWIVDQGYRLFAIGDTGQLQLTTPQKLSEFQNLLAIPLQ